MIATLIIGVLFLCAGLANIGGPSIYLWGTSSAAFLPAYISYPLFCVGFLSIASYFFVKENLSLQINQALGKFSEYWLLLPAGILFLNFSQETHLLGDGLLRIRELEHGIIFSPAEPLDTMIHALFYSILKPSFGIDGTGAYKLISILSGLLSLGGAIFYLKKIFAEKIKIYFTLMLVFFSGAAQLFFGYIESYSIMSAMLILFVLSTFNQMKEREFSYSPLIYFMIGLLCHPIMLAMAPALLYYFYKTFSAKSEGQIRSLLISASIVLLPASAMVAAFLLSDYPMDKFIQIAGAQSSFLPLSGNNGYNLFSLAHFTDIINLLLLIAPALIAIPHTFAYLLNKNKKTTKPFLLLSTIFPLLFIFLLDSKLGVSRDWDLFSFSAFPLSILIGFAVIETQEKRFIKIAIPMLTMSFIGSSQWIALNSGEESALRYAEFISGTDYWPNSAKAHLFDDIRTCYYKKGNESKAMEYNALAQKAYPNDRYLFSLAQMNINKKNYVDAKKLLIKLQKSHYKPLDVNLLLGSIYFGEKNYALAENAFVNVLKIKPDQKDALYYLGFSNYHSGNFKKALYYLEKSVRYYRSSSVLFSTLGELYYNSGNVDMAVKNFQRAKSLAPGKSNNNYNLALCFAELGKYKKALDYIDEAKRKGFKQEILNELEAEIRKLMK